MINIPFLTNTSRNKLEKINQPLNGDKLNIQLTNLLDKMKISLMNEIQIVSVKTLSVANLQKIFLDFDKSFNHVSNSTFQHNVRQMDGTISLDLIIYNESIRINFLFQNNDKPIGYMASILFAMHIFCHTFPYHYHGTTINICLDDNKRDLNFPTSINKYQDIYQYLRQKSVAFNVSGVTQRFYRTILLTKKEEIIKLLYHELVHLVGLDAILVNLPYSVGWAIEKNSLNLSEAYAEWISIILSSAYHSIHLSETLKMDIYQTFQNILSIETKYSIYLSATILHFLGYTANNFNNFFNGIGPKHYMPIMIWEYIFLRTQMLLNLDNIVTILQTDWMVNNDNKKEIILFVKINNHFLDELYLAMLNLASMDNISYTAIDLDWNLN